MQRAVFKLDPRGLEIWSGPRSKEKLFPYCQLPGRRQRISQYRVRTATEVNTILQSPGFASLRSIFAEANMLDMCDDETPLNDALQLLAIPIDDLDLADSIFFAEHGVEARKDFVDRFKNYSERVEDGVEKAEKYARAFKGYTELPENWQYCMRRSAYIAFFIHYGEKRKSDLDSQGRPKDYAEHVLDVAMNRVLNEIKLVHETTIEAAFLHDSIENFDRGILAVLTAEDADELEKSINGKPRKNRNHEAKFGDPEEKVRIRKLLSVLSGGAENHIMRKVVSGGSEEENSEKEDWQQAQGYWQQAQNRWQRAQENWKQARECSKTRQEKKQAKQAFESEKLIFGSCQETWEEAKTRWENSHEAQQLRKYKIDPEKYYKYPLIEYIIEAVSKAIWHDRIKGLMKLADLVTEKKTHLLYKKALKIFDYRIFPILLKLADRLSNGTDYKAGFLRKDPKEAKYQAAKESIEVLEYESIAVYLFAAEAFGMRDVADKLRDYFHPKWSENPDRRKKIEQTDEKNDSEWKSSFTAAVDAKFNGNVYVEFRPLSLRLFDESTMLGSDENAATQRQPKYEIRLFPIGDAVEPADIEAFCGEIFSGNLNEQGNAVADRYSKTHLGRSIAGNTNANITGVDTAGNAAICNIFNSADDYVESILGHVHLAYFKDNADSKKVLKRFVYGMESVKAVYEQPDDEQLKRPQVETPYFTGIDELEEPWAHYDHGGEDEDTTDPYYEPDLHESMDLSDILDPELRARSAARAIKGIDHDKSTGDKVYMINQEDDLPLHVGDGREPDDWHYDTGVLTSDRDPEGDYLSSAPGGFEQSEIKFRRLFEALIRRFIPDTSFVTKIHDPNFLTELQKYLLRDDTELMAASS